ncbi:MAG: ORF6N domain-containing protein [Candidatus Margulisiibacteriota bacterium]|jgi:hypothetical protein
MEKEKIAISLQIIERKIYFFRGVRVMLDRDLAELYGVETKALNQAVKRNLDRFPKEFMFQLTHAEAENWKSQFVTSNREKMGLRKLPYAFTEQGVAMLSGVLKSRTAINISIQIINAFVAMRQFITINAQIFHRLGAVERKLLEQKLETNEKFNEIFNALEKRAAIPKQGVFYDGQIFDAYQFISDLIRLAERSIIIIDNYVDDTVLTYLTKRKKGVKVTILTKTISRQLSLDVRKYNEQYPLVILEEFKEAHDRFMIIDNEIVYHFGASLKDLGKKWVAFSKMDIEAAVMLTRLWSK